MDLKPERDKLKALNLLGQRLQVTRGSTTLQGEVFFFNQKVLILKTENEYSFINCTKMEQWSKSGQSTIKTSRRNSLDPETTIPDHGMKKKMISMKTQIEFFLDDFYKRNRGYMVRFL